jgi:hypothetical protein
MDVFASGVTQSGARCSWLSASRPAERRSHLRTVRLGRPLITRNDLMSVDEVIFKATAADAAAVERQLRLDWKRIEQSVALFIANKQA